MLLLGFIFGIIFLAVTQVIVAYINNGFSFVNNDWEMEEINESK